MPSARLRSEGPGVIIGSSDDPHVHAVAAACEQQFALSPIVIDAAKLGRCRWALRGPELELLIDGRSAAGRGWVRRLAPAGTHNGLAIGSLEAAEAASRLAFVSAWSSSPVSWLTGYWHLLEAENKLVQYRMANRLGIPVPKFEVVSDASLISRDLGEKFIVKPLGLGEYRSESETYAVHSHVLERGDPRLSGLNEAPFLLQKLIEAKSHLRVVTVGERAWVASLDASGVPVDWRLDPVAHRSWIPSNRPSVERQALKLSAALKLGFSSQDWIVDGGGTAWFIDGNPAGQWLFLPPEVGAPATDAIASWLMGEVGPS